MPISNVTVPRVRPTMFAALLGAGCLSIPLALAQSDQGKAPGRAPSIAVSMPQPSGTGTAQGTTPAEVDQRINSLHVALKITPAEEPKWDAVASAMRANARKIQDLIAQKQASQPADETAIQDLESYQKFAEAHVENLNTLIPAFRSLYESMPDSQKKVADQVFRSFGQTQTQTQANPRG